jgi:hypothetical protein
MKRGKRRREAKRGDESMDNERKHIHMGSKSETGEGDEMKDEKGKSRVGAWKTKASAPGGMRKRKERRGAGMRNDGRVREMARNGTWRHRGRARRTEGDRVERESETETGGGSARRECEEGVRGK